jgi:predicted Na+-dependent transporter
MSHTYIPHIIPGKGVSLLSTLAKLGNVVILPLVLGQMARRTPVGAFFQRINKYARTFSSCLLLAIVFNVFSDTFLSGIGVGGAALLNLMCAMPLMYLGFSAIFWQISLKLLPGMVQKTPILLSFFLFFSILLSFPLFL